MSQVNTTSTTQTGSTPKVLILGGGLAGLAAAKRLVDNGFAVELLEKRNIYGGKVSSWKDADGDDIEAGLHCFFGAYSELYDLMKELGTYDRVLWKKHELTFTLSKGERFKFRAWPLPTPFHLLPTILGSKYFKLTEMLSFVKTFKDMFFGFEAYSKTQDGLTYEQWHAKQGISKRMLEKMFVPMTLALKFIRPEEISAKVVIDVMGKFLIMPSASNMGFLKGSPNDHLIEPLVQYAKSKGVKLHQGTRATEMLIDDQKNITGVKLANGEALTADYYLTALPIHNLQRLIPQALKDQWPFFKNLDAFKGVPVVSVQLWYDRQISNINNVLFSPDGVIPVYADMANTTPEYAKLRGQSHQGKSRFQFCVAPAKDLIKLSDEEIVAKVVASLKDCFPAETKDAVLLKHTVVRIPQSVYAPLPNYDKLRPTQATPVPNLFMAGGYTQQLYYDSMGGAVASANMAAREIIKQSKLSGKPNVADAVQV
jgi:15-cis-phytoene desaturase